MENFYKILVCLRKISATEWSGYLLQWYRLSYLFARATLHSLSLESKCNNWLSSTMSNFMISIPDSVPDRRLCSNKTRNDSRTNRKVVERSSTISYASYFEPIEIDKFTWLSNWPAGCRMRHFAIAGALAFPIITR